MWLVDFLARRLGRFAIPNLTILILVGQVFLYALMWVEIASQREGIIDSCRLMPEAVLQGEVWRVLSFLFVPPCENPICFLFYCSVFYLTGTALENTWGAARYNIYLLVGVVATVASALILCATTGVDFEASSAFMEGTVFLAFAYLYPNFMFTIYFLFPIKVKWLALVQWVSYALAFTFGNWMVRVTIAAAIANFMLFFGGAILQQMRANRRNMKWRARQLSTAKIRHHCTTCGINSETHPEMDFRYCSKCTGSLPYCTEHLRGHVHVTEEMSAERSKQPVG